jgi:hypothetical protein
LVPETVNRNPGPRFKIEKLCRLGKTPVDDERLQLDPSSKGQEPGESGVTQTPHRNGDGVHEEATQLVRVHRDGKPLLAQEVTGDVE